MPTVPIDNDLVEANKKYEAFGKLSDDSIIDFYGRLLGITVRDGGYLTSDGAAIKYAVERMPDEYKWGTENEGIISNEVLDKVNIGAYLQQAKDEGAGNKLDDEYDKAIGKADIYAQTVLPDVQTQDSAAEAQAGVVPSATGNFVVDAAMLGEMSAQEFAQTYKDTTLLDLGFDKTLKFNLAGVMAGGDLGGDDGIDVYEASRWLYSLTPEQVGRIQTRLESAGYFDQLGQRYASVNDYNDPATRMAWDLFLVDVARSGSQTKPQDLLNQRINTFQQNRTSPEGIVFSDVATLQSLANEFGRAMVGRDLSLEEQRTFIAKAREWEKEASAGMTFAKENEKVDVRARAEAYFDKQFRIEQSKQIAFDWASKFK